MNEGMDCSNAVKALQNSLKISNFSDSFFRHCTFIFNAMRAQFHRTQLVFLAFYVKIILSPRPTKTQKILSVQKIYRSDQKCYQAPQFSTNHFLSWNSRWLFDSNDPSLHRHFWETNLSGLWITFRHHLVYTEHVSVWLVIERLEKNFKQTNQV